MVARSLLEIIEPITAMDLGSIAKDFQTIAQASSHIEEQMYAGLMLSFSFDTFFQYLAVVAAIYLFAIDRTNWRTNILTALLVLYITLNLPDIILHCIRSKIGAWIAFIAIVVRLFFPQHSTPAHTELPATLIVLLVVVLPTFLINFRFWYPGEIISIAVGFYLLYEHILHAGGFTQAFAEREVLITIGILLLFVDPVWQLVFSFL